MKIIINKLGLYISSFIPLYFLIILKILVEIFNGNWTTNFLNIFNACVLFLLIIFGSTVLYNTIKKCKSSEKKEIKILKKNNITDNHFLGYFSLFVLFAISFEIEMMSMSIVFFIVLIFIGIVYIKNDLYYINPLLNLLGFSFYDITYIEKINIKKHMQKNMYLNNLIKQKLSSKNLKILKNYKKYVKNIKKINKIAYFCSLIKNKINNSNEIEEKTTKVFYRGRLIESNNYLININTPNLSFLDTLKH